MTAPSQVPRPPGEAAEATLEHLQHAAVEMIASARSALDLLEDVVTSPGGLAAVAGQVGHLAQALAAAAVAVAGRQPAEDASAAGPGTATAAPTGDVLGAAGRAVAAADTAGPEGRTAGGPSPRRVASRVEHIRVDPGTKG